MNAQDYGASGESIELEMGDMAPCIHVGLEFQWMERCGTVTAINRAENMLTLTFSPVFFSARVEDGVMRKWEHKDDMMGTVTVREVPAE